MPLKSEPEAEIEAPKTASIKFKNVKPAALVSITIGIVILVGFIGFPRKKPLSNLDKASFSAQKNTGHEIPNTVVFKYNVDEVDADSFFIQQSWDVARRVRVFKGEHILTDIYYEPGYHLAKLIANDSIIRTIDISIPTDHWFLYAKDKKPGSTPQYIKPIHAINNGLFTIDRKDLIDNQIDIQKEKNYIYTFFPSKIEVNSDNFILKTKVRMKEIKNNFCPYVMVEVFCQRNFMFFKTAPKGCASESIVQFGEKYISGKTNNLFSIGYDVTQWKDVEISVRNRKVKIVFDNKEVFSTSYKNPSGLITGLGFISNGLCEIDLVELKGWDEKVVYQNNFED